MGWEQSIFTNAGLELVRRCADTTGAVEITSVQTCEAIYPESSLPGATGLAGPAAQTLPVVGTETDGPGHRVLTVQAASAGLEDSYRLRQIGVFARGGAQEAPVLLFIMQDETGFLVPSETELPYWSMAIRIVLSIETPIGLTVTRETFFVPADRSVTRRKLAPSVEAMLTASIGGQPRAGNLPDGILEELLECGMTYYREGAGITYGNSFTPNNENEDRYPFEILDPDQTIAPATYLDPALYPIGWTDEPYQPDPADEATEGGEEIDTGDGVSGDADEGDSSGMVRLHLDCSSFVFQVLSGVPYSSSRMARSQSDPNVPARTTNTRYYDWGLTWPGKEAYYPQDKPLQQRMLAEGIARYCDDNGWSFTPDLDGGNLRPGDLLFFEATREDGQEDLYYLNIRHVAFFLWTNGYGQSVVLDCSTSDQSFADPAKTGRRPVRVRVISSKYRRLAVRAARIPLASKRSGSTLPGGSTCPPPDRTPLSRKGGLFVGVKAPRLVPLSHNLVPSTFYTAEAWIDQEPGQHRQFFAVSPRGMSAIIERVMVPSNKSPDGLYTFHFFVTMDGWIIARPDGWFTPTQEGSQGVTLCSAAYYERGDTVPEEDPGKNPGDYMSLGCDQIRTWVRRFCLYNTLFFPSRSAGEDAAASTLDEAGTELAVSLPPAWEELTLDLSISRAGTGQDYVACHLGADTAADRRLMYLSLGNDSAKLSARAVIRRAFDGSLFTVAGSYSAKAAASTSLESSTAFNRAIATDAADDSLVFRLAGGGNIAAGSSVRIRCR